MVNRIEFKKNLNKPLLRILNYRSWWVKEVGDRWWCKMCGHEQPKGSVAFELLVRFARKNVAGKDIDKPVKHSVCLACTEKMFEEALVRIKICKQHGADGFKLFDET